MTSELGNQYEPPYLYFVRTFHKRNSPIEHKFEYPLFFVGIDILNPYINYNKHGLPKWLFNINGTGILSIREDNYLGSSHSNLKDRFLHLIETTTEIKRGEIDKVLLITTPRVFGYAFNPVSFYFIYNLDSELIGCVYEVNNTFGEKYWYPMVLNEDQLDHPSKSLEFIQPKKFHVSPLNHRQGHYKTRLIDPLIHNYLKVSISLVKNATDKQTWFYADVQGIQKSLNLVTYFQLLFNYPINVFLTFPRIIYQAYQLHYKKQLKIFPRPNPIDQTLVKKKPSSREIKFRELCLEWFRRLINYHGDYVLEVVGPQHNEYYEFTPANNPLGKLEKIKLVLNSYDLYTSLVLYSTDEREFALSLGLSHMTNSFSCDQLASFIDLISTTLPTSSHDPKAWTWFFNLNTKSRLYFKRNYWRMNWHEFQEDSLFDQMPNWLAQMSAPLKKQQARRRKTPSWLEPIDEPRNHPIDQIYFDSFDYIIDYWYLYFNLILFTITLFLQGLSDKLEMRVFYYLATFHENYNMLRKSQRFLDYCQLYFQGQLLSTENESEYFREVPNPLEREKMNTFLSVMDEFED